MSTRFRIAMGVAAVLLCALPVSAQNQKIGFIDSEYILSKLPEFTGLDQRLRSKSDGWSTEIEAMSAEITRLEQDFIAREILYTPEVRKQKQDEITAKIRTRDQFIQSKFGPEGDYFKQQEQLLEPIQRKVMEAVERVAQRDGFDFVFDRSGDYMFLFTWDSWNLSDEVLLELGIQINQ